MNLESRKSGAHVANTLILVNAALHFARNRSIMQLLHILINILTTLKIVRITLGPLFAPIWSLPAFLWLFHQ